MVQSFYILNINCLIKHYRWDTICLYKLIFIPKIIWELKLKYWECPVIYVITQLTWQEMGNSCITDIIYVICNNFLFTYSIHWTFYTCIQQLKRSDCLCAFVYQIEAHSTHKIQLFMQLQAMMLCKCTCKCWCWC